MSGSPSASLEPPPLFPSAIPIPGYGNAPGDAKPVQYPHLHCWSVCPASAQVSPGQFVVNHGKNHLEFVDSQKPSQSGLIDVAAVNGLPKCFREKFHFRVNIHQHWPCPQLSKAKKVNSKTIVWTSYSMRRSNGRATIRCALSLCCWPMPTMMRKIWSSRVLILNWTISQMPNNCCFCCSMAKAEESTEKGAILPPPPP